ncbi:hypothetical protein [Winogradskyella sp.]|nr:hypothetical protein [Winogradskyella sp.]
MIKFFRLSQHHFAVTLSAVEMKQNQRSGRPLVEIAACGKIRNYD